MKIDLLKNLPVDACKEGIETLIASKSDADLHETFFKYIDFCLATNFPGIEAIKRTEGYLEAGIIVDRKLVRNDVERIAILGRSDFELNCSKFTVSRVYVTDNSELYINASDNAYVVVDALESAKVFCKVKDRARVVVNLFADAQASGATKVIVKNRRTYDLQA